MESIINVEYVSITLMRRCCNPCCNGINHKLYYEWTIFYVFNVVILVVMESIINNLFFNKIRNNYLFIPICNYLIFRYILSILLFFANPHAFYVKHWDFEATPFVTICCATS